MDGLYNSLIKEYYGLACLECGQDKQLDILNIMFKELNISKKCQIHLLTLFQ